MPSLVLELRTPLTKMNLSQPQSACELRSDAGHTEQSPLPQPRGLGSFLEEVPSQLKPESEVGGWEAFQAQGPASM